MKRIVADEWVKALRSNVYTKARFCLCDGGNRLSALGVLCEISSLGMFSKVEDKGYYKFNSFITPENPRSVDSGIYSLPQAVLEWSGAKTKDLIFHDENFIKRDFHYLNNQYSFSEIANFIENNWLWL